MPVAYGADYEFSTNPQKWDGVFHSHPITSAEDAGKLGILNTTNDTLAAEVAVDGRIVDTYKGEKPVLATLFDPLSWVQELSTPMNPDWTLDLMRSDPKALTHALEALQETNEHFLDALIDKGIDGIFMATKYSRSTLITPEEHREFVVPYLEHMAKKLKGRTWFSMLHVHGDEGLITGFDQNHDFYGTPEQVKRRLATRLEDTLAQNDGGALIFGPGCTLPLDVDRSLFSLIYEVVHEAGLR